MKDETDTIDKPEIPVDDRIITSILDTDFYKLTMQQCVFHQYPDSVVEYEFRCRNKGVNLAHLGQDLYDQIHSLKELALTTAEADYLRSLGFFKEDYIEYLENYRYDPLEVSVGLSNGELHIKIYGPWVRTILWEVKILAIVNELYFRGNEDATKGEGHRRLDEKIKMFKEMPRLTFAEFGTRRRYSADWQMEVATRLKNECPNMVGISNVKLAMDLDIKPIGTMAHEYISAHLALTDNIAEAQKRAMHVWLQEYDDNLGIALTDTFTSKAFFNDFGEVLSNSFDGLRHDSGDPIEFGYNAIEHYKSKGIDPLTKVLVFSDGLDPETAIAIYKEFTGLIGISFGIGTNLTNDLGAKALNIVIKMLVCNNVNVVKLSDNPAKAIGDPDMVKDVKEAYGVIEVVEACYA